jgi:hypothetical protein
MLKSVSRLGQATYGPTTREEAKAVKSILNRLKTFPLEFMGQMASPGQDGQERIMLIVTHKRIATENR